MKNTHTYYSIQNKKYKFYYRGKAFSGENRTLINQEDNLIQKTNFNNLGYKIINLKLATSWLIFYPWSLIWSSIWSLIWSSIWLSIWSLIWSL